MKLVIHKPLAFLCPDCHRILSKSDLSEHDVKGKNQYHVWKCTCGCECTNEISRITKGGEK